MHCMIDEKCRQDISQNMKGRDFLGNVGVKVVVKWILQK